MANGPIKQHHVMAEGKSMTGMKKGGKVKAKPRNDYTPMMSGPMDEGEGAPMRRGGKVRRGSRKKD